VLEAVSQNGMALEYTEIREKEIVLAAVEQTETVLLIDPSDCLCCCKTWRLCISLVT